MDNPQIPRETEWMFDPKDLGRFLWRHKAWIVVGFILGSVGGYLYSLTLPDNYRVTASILPQQASESRLSGALSALGGLVGGGAGGGDANSRVYPTIFKSRRILKPALEVEQGGRTFREIFAERFKPKKNSDLKLIEIVQKKVVDVTVDRGSGVTTLTVTYPDPSIAAGFANALLRQLDHFFNFQYQTAASLQKRMMETRLESVTDSLRTSENRLADFLARNHSFENSPELAIREMRLRRDLEVQATIYKELLRQREAVKFDELSLNPVLNVLDEAVPALEKFAPIRRKIAAMAGVGAVLAMLLLLKLAEMVRLRPGVRE